MTEEKTGDNQGENPTSPEKRERVAVCLVCSNEWIARTGTAKKPAKCPTCGTKRCAWKDDLPTKPENQPGEQEKTAVFAGEKGENEGEEKEKTGEIEEKTEEKREEKRENTTTSVKSTISPEKTAISLNGEKGENGGKKPEEKTAPGNFPVILVVAGLVVLGTIAGVGWFLGRRKNYVPKPVPASFRPMPQAERAMTRMGGI